VRRAESSAIRTASNASGLTRTRTSLLRHGYNVIEAPDAQTALGLSRERGGRINLVLTDVVMPAIGGRDLADQLVAARPGLKV
jgi:two-component system cell cycle sensor histidine kinase/response regulator CckA